MTVQHRAEPPGTGKGRAGTAPTPDAPVTSDVPGGMAEAFASVTGSPGATLPFLDLIQPAFGDHDLTGVAAHTGDDARVASEQLGATAFATGNHVAFAGAPDLHTAAHEATHVVHQRSGVHLKGGIGAAGDAYEREADAVADRVVAGESAAPLLERYTPSAGSPRRLDLVQRKPDVPTGQPSPPAAPYVEAAEDLDEDLAPDTDAPIQCQAAPRKRSYIPFQIAISRDMTGEEFKAAANRQVFGVAALRSEWRNLKDAYTVADSPVAIGVEAGLLRRVRGAINARAGIDTDATGGVVGADARAADFLAQPASDEKSAVLAEIDRRYYARSGAAAGSTIKPGETGNRALWSSIRDEVLFQHQHLANLPEKVRTVIRAGIQGRELGPSDYDQLFRVAKKIEALPPGMAADYAAKVTSSTTDLSAFEASVDAYRTDLAARTTEGAERTAVQNKLLGLDEVYRLYRRYETATAVETNPEVAANTQLARNLGLPVETASDLQQQLEAQLPRYGLASIAELRSYIGRFVTAFEAGAVRITADVLGRYAGTLYQEQQRYQDPAVIADLHARLGAFRAEHHAFERNATVWNDYAARANRDHERGRIPGNGHVHPRPPSSDQAAAGENAKAAKASAEAQIRTLSTDYPIFAEDGLPVDKRLDKVALAQADQPSLAAVLLAHIAERQQVVTDARDQLQSNPALVYKLDRLTPRFYAEMDIQPGSIYDAILRDRMRDDAIAKAVSGLLLAVVAVALTVVSAGTATSALIAAGAAIGAAGINTYLAYEEYKDYTAEHALAEAQLADDPTVAWLLLAILGAGIDVAAAATAVSALAPAARTLHTGGDLTDFTAAVQALEQSRQLDHAVAAAASRAATARTAYAAARGDLGAALGKAYSFPGPLLDPDVYRAVVHMAVAKLREGSHSLSAFLADLKQARLAAKLGDLSPEELTRAKQAWDEAEALARSAESPVDLLDYAGDVVGRYQHGSQLEVISRKKLYGGNIIRLDENATTTLTGTLDDTDSIARRGVRLPGATVMGENPGGLNILRSPKWGEIKLKHQPLLQAQGETAYWKAVTDEFWETVNKPWLDEAIARGDAFRFVSNPTDEKALFVLSRNKRSFVLDNGTRIQSIFGREVEYLTSKGYVFNADGTASKVN